jgi:Methyltransferase domain
MINSHSSRCNPPGNEAEGMPRPSVMPIDREAWRKELDLSNFVNSYYQYRDLMKWVGDGASILIIGPGQGLDTAVFKWKGFRVVTFDIDNTFSPDVIGSCHAMPMFEKAQFDVVIASHVLEHLPLPYLDLALVEIARVGRHAIFYLPVAGRHAILRFMPGFRGIDWAAIADFCRFWERPDGVSARYCGGQHYWEVGMRGFRVPDLRERFSRSFDVLDAYRNRDWLPSFNFVLRSKQCVSTPTIAKM